MLNLKNRTAYTLHDDEKIKLLNFSIDVMLEASIPPFDINDLLGLAILTEFRRADETLERSMERQMPLFEENFKQLLKDLIALSDNNEKYVAYCANYEDEG